MSELAFFLLVAPSDHLVILAAPCLSAGVEVRVRVLDLSFLVLPLALCLLLATCVVVRHRPVAGSTYLLHLRVKVHYKTIRLIISRRLSAQS